MGAFEIMKKHYTVHCDKCGKSIHTHDVILDQEELLAAGWEPAYPLDDGRELILCPACLAGLPSDELIVLEARRSFLMEEA
jgi:hypothetical protein